MIDRFFVDRLLLKLDPHKERIRDIAFEELDNILRTDVFVPVDDRLLETSNFAQVQERVFLTELDWSLRKLTGLYYIEKMFLEVALLHRLHVVYMSMEANRTLRETRSMKVLGTMMRQRLILLLLQVAPDQYTKLYSIGKLPNLDADEWKNAFVGAASFVRAAQAFSAIEECSVYCASLHEDLDVGLNMVVINHKTNLGFCVLVSSSNNDERFYTEHVHTLPWENDDSVVAHKRRRIFDGTAKFNQFNQRDFMAIRIAVGRPNGEAIDLNPYPEDTYCVRLRMERIHEEMQRHKQHQDVA